MDNFVLNYLLDCSELFVSRFSDKIKKAQELNYLKDCRVKKRILNGANTK